jgi:hypothetical protein
MARVNVTLTTPSETKQDFMGGIIPGFARDLPGDDPLNPNLDLFVRFLSELIT